MWHPAANLPLSPKIAALVYVGTVIARPVICGGVAVILLGVAGCGESKDNWYEYSSGVDQRERSYVDQQMQHGMSELEAKRAFSRQYSIERTQGVTDPTAGRVVEFEPK
ncbi:MAG TPA: hypothetical protein PKE12_00390 [Kiritimatiellia bacterium]|nr:hypothetical protein [Kiritimatiellia bacterium]